MAKRLVHQFRVTLLDVEPAVWRRIQTPAGYSFWDLHVALQDAMGWTDSHLHDFLIKKPRGRKVWSIGYPDGLREGVLPGWRTAVADYFTKPGSMATYVYDFGDDWRHELLLEGVLLAEDGVTYPRCLAGARACPPEDCLGPPGYEQLLKIISDPSHEEYGERVRWLASRVPDNQPFDPERFDSAAVVFDDPRERRQLAFGAP